MTKTKTTQFTAVDAQGKTYAWKFWHEPGIKGGGLWFLQDPEGYARPLERTWIDSVPRIRAVLKNHDQYTDVILENLPNAIDNEAKEQIRLKKAKCPYCGEEASVMWLYGSANREEVSWCAAGHVAVSIGGVRQTIAFDFHSEALNEAML